MAPQGLMRRTLAAATSALAVALLLASCGKKEGAKPVVGGFLGFDQRTATLFNDPIPRGDPGIACGSRTAEFGVELTSVASPTNAKVLKEWGEVVPGKQMYLTGTIRDFQFSTGDLTFTHPFGTDITFDITPDRPYARLAQKLGAGGPDADGPPPGTVHWEIERGLVPHTDNGFYLPGFVPEQGDRIATYGRWIIDCGHNDYHSEIHPPTFFAFGHVQNNTTVAHAVYNPYYESQLFTPDPSLSAKLEDQARLIDPNTRPFPTYLYQQLLRLGHIGQPGPLGFIDHIEAHMLEEANTDSPMHWYVCAPGPKPNGASLSVSYHFTARRGVTVTATPDQSTGCVFFTGTLGKGFTPLDPVRKDCVDPWSELNAQAQAALGAPDVDIEKLIEQKVPASFAPLVKRDPTVDCYDDIVVPLPGGPRQNQSTGLLPGSPGPPAERVFTANDQPYPFYGTIEVSWKGGTSA